MPGLSRVVLRRELAGDLLASPEQDAGGEKDLSRAEAIEAMSAALAPLHQEFMRAIGTRKRKRSTSPSEELGPTQSELRLLSLRPIYVSICEQLEGWQGYSQPRQLTLEDTEKEELERKYRAEVAAVDASLLLKQSTIAYPAVKTAPVATYKAKGDPVLGPLVVIESLKAAPISIMPHCLPQCQLHSRNPKPKADLIVDAHPPYEETSKLRMDPPFRSFYHSLDNIGGKSAGYAWGYPGSHPRPSNVTGYVRDTTKKGLDNRGEHPTRAYSGTGRGRGPQGR